jgi:hypothetical protein
MIIKRRATVTTKVSYAIVLVASICVANLVMSGASAITVEVAKKCGNLANKAFPPRVPGNPAAGHANGTAGDFKKYFDNCVANGGNPQAPAQGNAKSDQAPEGAGNKDQGPTQTK